MWARLKINCSARVHRDEGTCHAVQQWDHLSVFNSFWTTRDLTTQIILVSRKNSLNRLMGDINKHVKLQNTNVTMYTVPKMSMCC